MHQALSGFPSVAVIIPCFNTARYVAQAVGSACEQTYPNLDIVVVSDGSTDNFAASIAPFRSRVRTIDQPNLGLSAARNAGIAATATDLIAFLDADDAWDRSKIERQVAFLRTHPDSALVHTDIRRMDASGSVQPARPRPQTRARLGCRTSLFAGNPLIVSSVLVRRSALPPEPFHTALRAAEDWDLWLRLAGRANFGYLEAPLTDYRIHTGNMSADSRRMLEAELQVLARAVGRAVTREERRAAVGARRAAMRRLAHARYEHGDMAAARTLLVSLLPSWHRIDALRCIASLLPCSARRAARRLAQGM